MQKNKKYKYTLFLIFAMIFILSANSAFAFEIAYPSVPFVNAPNANCTDNCLGEYTAYAAGILMYVAGVIAVISFAIGAVSLVGAMDDPEMQSSAKERMRNSILGGVLAVSACIFLKAINPVLALPSANNPVKEVIRPTVTQPGVYLYASGGCNGGASTAITESEDDIGTPFRGYVASIKIVNSGTLQYGAILHQNTGLTNGGLCSLPITTAGCQNIDASIKASAIDVFKLNNNSSANGASGNGVVFYSEPYGWDTGANAGCYAVTDNPNEDTCPNHVSLGQQYKGDPSKICYNYTNVTRPDKYKYMCPDNPEAGVCGNSNNSCNKTDGLGCAFGETCNQTTGVCMNSDGSSARCSDTACETFQDCPGSIKINGSYLVALYGTANNSSNSGNGGTQYCQTFTANVQNLNTQPYAATERGGAAVGAIYIFPTQ